MKNKTCPNCGSEKTVWRGRRYNQCGKKHLRLCKECSRKFIPDDGFLGMRHKSRHIVVAVDLYRSGLSLQQVKNHLWQHYSVNVARKTVLEWVRKYSKLIEKFFDKQKQEIKGNVHADEVILKVKDKKSTTGERKIGKPSSNWQRNPPINEISLELRTSSKNSNTTAKEDRQRLSPTSWASIGEHTTNTSTTQIQNLFMVYPSLARNMV